MRARIGRHSAAAAYGGVAVLELQGSQHRLQKIGRQVGPSVEASLAINRLRLLTHGAVARVTRARDFLQPYAFQHQVGDAALGWGESPVVELSFDLCIHNPSQGGGIPASIGLPSPLRDLVRQALQRLA